MDGVGYIHAYTKTDIYITIAYIRTISTIAHACIAPKQKHIRICKFACI